MNSSDPITIIIKENFDIYNYTCSQNYLFLPAINEYTWGHNVRVALYLLGLIWCFLGVAYLADIFMASIERITSKTRTMKIPDPEVPGGVREVQLKVWNDTVANLSLLALGTSAPEILLSVIEIAGNNFESGELGPGTIVGSAAFNLLFISAICISCIPDGETRRIHSFKVFGVTSFSCVFAYVWMVIVLMAISPDVIEVWEAILTFSFFPIMLVVAYAAEKDFFMKQTPVPEKHVVGFPLAITNGDVVTVDEIHTNDVIANGDVVTNLETNDVITNGEMVTVEEPPADDASPKATSSKDNKSSTDHQRQSRDSKNSGAVDPVHPQKQSSKDLKQQAPYNSARTSDDPVSEEDEIRRLAKFSAPPKATSSKNNKSSTDHQRQSSDRKNSGAVDPVDPPKQSIRDLKQQASANSVLSSDDTSSEEDEIGRLAKTLTLTTSMTPDMVAEILAHRFVDDTPHNRGWYRMNAIRGLTGAKKLIAQSTFDLEEVRRISGVGPLSGEDRRSFKRSETPDPTKGGKLAVVEFTSAACAVMENEGAVRLGVKRTGRMNIPVSVRVQTINGTAVADEDYVPYNKVIEFKEGEALKHIFIDIVDDTVWEPDEFFFVKLKVEENTENCVAGSVSICEVTIINDDEPGVLEFSKPSFIIKETEAIITIPVIRKNGTDGQISVKWVTRNISAVEGVDYVGKEGELIFDEQETERSIVIRCIEKQKKDRDDSFQIELKDATNGAVIGKLNRTIVTIINDEEFDGLVSRIVNMSKMNQEALELPFTTYSQQFVEAMNVNGGDLENATFMSYVLHFLAFFWKFMFAFIPPTHFCGGWATFIFSLSLIGLLTAIIGDLASIFGCLIGLEDSITAITLVAMGTSMPDTFASKTAAIMEKTADSSIGNVNGSNSVNVFLGLGLPWLMASVYHYMKGDNFIVPAGSLGFSVIIYSIVAVVAITILILRRTSPYIGAELGGPKHSKIMCSIFFVLLWVFYIVISALQVKDIIQVKIGE